jgi:hypothetical protein
MRSKLPSSVIVAGIALLFITFSVNPVAEAGLMDQIQKLAGQSTPSTAASPAVTATPPLGKFAASGRVTESLDNGACAGSVAASGGACTPSTNCVQVQVSGPVNATGLGKSNLSACMTFDNTAVSSTLSACFDGLGTGTITGPGGKSINVAMGGLLCVGDEFPLPTPTNVLFVLTSSYSVEGGGGAFTNAVGSGNMSLSALITNITAPPIAASGQINFTGTLAKQ